MQFFSLFKQQDKQRVYGICVLAVCLTCFYVAPEAAPAKPAKEKAKAPKAKKAKSVKKRADVTPFDEDEDEDVWTFTLESNFYRSTLFLNPTLDYSTKDGWDVQLAVYSIPVYGGTPRSGEWDSYINLSKTFELSEQFQALVGTQNGTPVFSGPRQWHSFEYGLLFYEPVQGINFRVGPYLVNKALAETTNAVGYTAGFNWELVRKKLLLQGDYFSGNASVSGAVVNFSYQLTPKAQIYLGVGVPESHTGSEFFGIVGFSLASKPF